MIQFINKGGSGGKAVLSDGTIFGNATSTFTNFDMNNFDTSNMTSFYQMFYNCTALTSINFGNIDTKNIENMSNMFNGCTALSSISLNGLNTEKVSTMSSMFRNCTNLQDIDWGTFTLTGIHGSTTFSKFFDGCSSLSNNTLNGFLALLPSSGITSSNVKKLSNFGLTQTQAETCTTLSNWQACVNAGWITGY